MGHSLRAFPYCAWTEEYPYLLHHVYKEQVVELSPIMRGKITANGSYTTSEQWDFLLWEFLFECGLRIYYKTSVNTEMWYFLYKILLSTKFLIQRDH